MSLGARFEIDAAFATATDDAPQPEKLDRPGARRPVATRKQHNSSAFERDHQFAGAHFAPQPGACDSLQPPLQSGGCFFSRARAAPRRRPLLRRPHPRASGRRADGAGSSRGARVERHERTGLVVSRSNPLALKTRRRLDRPRRPEARNRRRRRRRLDRQLHAQRSLLRRSGAENPATLRQPVRPEVVAHVSGASRHPCLWSGQIICGERGGTRTHDPLIKSPKFGLDRAGHIRNSHPTESP